MNEQHSDQASPSTRVALEFESFREFVEEYSSRISAQGIFIATDSPPSVGSAVEFRISLSDDFRLLQGTGEVAWTVGEGEAPGLPAGMALRLSEVDDSSRRLIERLVENHRNSGGDVFDLELGEAAPPEAASPGPIFDQGTYEAVDFLIDGPPSEPGAAAPDSAAEETDLLGEAPIPPPDELLFDTVPEADEPAPLEPPRSAAEPDLAAPPGEPGDDRLSPFELPAEGEELLTVPDLPIEEEGPPAAAPAEPPPVEPSPPVTEPALEEPPAPEAAVTPPVGLDLEHEEPLSFPEREEEEGAVPIAGSAAVRSGRRRLGFLIGGLALVALLALGYLQRDSLRSLLGGAGPETGAESAAAAAGPAAGAPEAMPEAAAPPAPEEMVEAPPPVPAVDEPLESAEPAAAVFSGVDQILWREIDGQTMLILRADAAIDPERFEIVQLDGGSPRTVIKLRGAERPFDRIQIEVGTGQIEQVRVGFHTLEGGSELHFVADLSGPEVRVVSSEVVGQELRILFSGRS